MPAQNSRRSAGKPKPPPGRPFRKGKSGNPGGRPKVPPDVREALKLACPAAVDRVVALMQAKDGMVALLAAKTIIERVLGKVAQPLELTGKDGKPIESKATVRDDRPERTTAAVLEALARAGVVAPAVAAKGVGAGADSAAD